MSKLQTKQSKDLSETMPSPGITRHLAFKNDECLVLRARSDPGVISGWHTHGDYHVYGYLVSGTARLESSPGEANAIFLQPGDFFHVPPHTAHREINPSREQGNEFILFLHGSGQMVYNIENPDEN